MSERPARPGEVCTCGRPAVTVFATADHGEVGYCGLPDGGDQTGPCPHCGGERHDVGPCPKYRIRPDSAMSDIKGGRVLLSVLASIAAVLLITFAASFAPTPPQPCHIPGHARTTVVECEDR